MDKNQLSVLALDVGTKYIGVATSRRGSFLATPLQAIIRSESQTELDAIKNIIKEYRVNFILVGMPYTLETGVKSDMCIIVEKLIEAIQKELPPHIQMKTVDERLSSWSTKSQHKKLKRGTHSANLDSMVALSFIEEYMEKPSN